MLLVPERLHQPAIVVNEKAELNVKGDLRGESEGRPFRHVADHRDEHNGQTDEAGPNDKVLKRDLIGSMV